MNLIMFHLTSNNFLKKREKAEGLEPLKVYNMETSAVENSHG